MPTTHLYCPILNPITDAEIQKYADKLSTTSEMKIVVEEAKKILQNTYENNRDFLACRSRHPLLAGLFLALIEKHKIAITQETIAKNTPRTLGGGAKDTADPILLRANRNRWKKTFPIFFLADKSGGEKSQK